MMCSPSEPARGNCSVAVGAGCAGGGAATVTGVVVVVVTDAATVNVASAITVAWAETVTGELPNGTVIGTTSDCPGWTTTECVESPRRITKVTGPTATGD